MKTRNRNFAIDILKFIAVLLITNSHFDEQYVYCKELATGGAIGDALFFFCSGYTLFLGRFGCFDTWYKRRIRRIYPSVLGLGLIVLFLYHTDMTIGCVLTDGAGWFVECIMIYYIFLYFIRKYAIRQLKTVYIIVFVLVLVWYFLFFEPLHSYIMKHCAMLDWMVFCEPMDKVWIYQWNYFKWGFFFLFMLMGAHLGLSESNNKHLPCRSFLQTFGMLQLSILAFYALPVVSIRLPLLQKYTIITLFPLAGVCIYLYRLCQTKVAISLFRRRYVGWCIKAIAGLCLEIYLVQPFVRTTALNYLFPLNLLILFVAIVIVAYLCRSLGRLIQQTFSSEDGYNWETIFKVI